MANKLLAPELWITYYRARHDRWQTWPIGHHWGEAGKKEQDVDAEVDKGLAGGVF